MRNVAQGLGAGMRSGRRLVGLGLALAIALAGCATPEGAEPPKATNEDSFGGEPPQKGVSPIPEPGASAPFWVNTTISDCANLRFLFSLDDEYARGQLPKGFHPMEAAEIFRVFDIPVPAGIDSTKALGLFDRLECKESTRGSYKHSLAVIFVDLPQLTAHTPTRSPRELNFYVTDWAMESDLFEPYVKPFWDEDFHDLGGSLAYESIMEPGGGSGSVKIMYGDRQVSAVEFQAVTPDDEGYEVEPVTTRPWHVGSKGTMYVDAVQHGVQFMGPVISCSNAPGYGPHRVSNTTDCVTNPGWSLSQVRESGSFPIRFLPGVFPVAS